jgi:hypothetical protein
MDTYKEWKGRLVVKWPPDASGGGGPRAMIFPFTPFTRRACLTPRCHRDQLSLTWEVLRVLPTKWKTALRHWREIYYIFDVKVAKGYVGSACGEENILGRWLDYSASGHGGNKMLKERQPSDFVFTILQRTSPDMEADEINLPESSWKDRLHTREYGLNEN